MYDWPEIRPATDRFWTEIRNRLADRGINAPKNLTRNRPEMETWTDPELVVAQSCGLPYVLDLRPGVTLVGTPAYDLVCDTGNYFSVIVVRKGAKESDLSSVHRSCFAYNSRRSQSGFAAFGHALTAGVSSDAAPARYLCTRSHRQSVRAVAGGSADIASIDAVSWELALRHEPAAAALRVLMRTAPTPGLPLISASSGDRADAVAEVVEEAIAALDPNTRQSLLITGFVRSKPSDYDVIAERYAALSTTPFFTAVQ